MSVQLNCASNLTPRLIHLSSSIIAQDLNIEEYDWYGYGETYGSEAKLRTDYRYKQVRVVQKLVAGGGVRTGSGKIFTLTGFEMRKEGQNPFF